MAGVLQMPTAEVFVPLLSPARYKGAYGGRGSGKSHFFAELLIEYALASPGDYGEGLRGICIRQVQRDLAQSSKQLIETKLNHYGLGSAAGFKVFRECISTPRDGIISFKGMQEYNADSVKSLEGYRVSWWEEAHGAASQSLSLLRPTMRAKGSELWFSWNPRLATDPVDRLFRGGEPPTGAVCVNANWRDNPWLTAELQQERLDCLREQPDQYEHIWEGAYVTAQAGAYFAEGLATARLQRRIGRVGADPLMTYHLFCDLGGTGARSDAFTIWCVQFIGREIRVLDYYEVVGQPLSAHLLWMRGRGYLPANSQVWLPHDGSSNDRVFDTSFESSFRQAGYRVEVVPNQGKGAARLRIEAVHRIMPLCWFNEDAVTDGLSALGWYHEKRDVKRNMGLGPEHDWSSHGADAFGLMAIVYEQQFKRELAAQVQATTGRRGQKINRANWRTV